MRRPSAATVIASAALFISLGGTGYAAMTLKRGSVTSREIRNGSIRPVDLSAAARPKPGIPGPQGPAGKDGERGPQGPAGQDGMAYSAPVAPANPSFDLDAASWQQTGGGSFERTTDPGDYDSSPAAGKWNPTAGTLIEKFTGTFWAGRSYTLHFKLKRQEVGPPVTNPTVTVTFGVWGSDTAQTVIEPTPDYAGYAISWTPTRDSSYVWLRLSREPRGIYLIDSLSLD